jgi:hypothetical protein
MPVRFGAVSEVDHFGGTLIADTGEEIHFRRADGMAPDPRNPRQARSATEKLPRRGERIAFEESHGLTSWWMSADSYEHLGCSNARLRGG